MNESSQVGIVILAAGSSSRLGTPKQLLLYRQVPLLRYIVHEALQSNADSVTIVLGYQETEIRKIIADLPVRIVLNTHWQEGIASSIRAGVQAVMGRSESMLILLCDQPSVERHFINKLIDAQNEPKKNIIASRYSNSVGVPALFHKKFFAELLSLTGDSGAKRIIEIHADELLEVDFPEGKYDIDTVADIVIE